MQELDGITLVPAPDGATCRCGVTVASGERAGFDASHDEVVCLHCLADLQAGRRRPRRRPQVAPPAPRLASVPPNPSAPVWIAAGPGGHRARPVARRRRTVIGLAVAVPVAAVLAVLVLLHAGALGAANPIARAHDDPGAYAFLTTDPRGRPVTWDPCLPIQLVVNSASAPAGSDTLLSEAVERVNEASGLHLEILGPTQQAPDWNQTQRELRSGRPGAGRAPVLVAWTTPEVVPGLEGTVVGRGGPVWQQGSALDRAKYIGGSVYLDGPQLASVLRGVNGQARARAVVMHELGHLAGLDHVDNSAEIMNPTSGVATEFAMGDRAGLARLGSGGCPYGSSAGAAS